ncbi:MAG: hypothetical protein HY314_06520 [Acidobacteria bacterium]|nr:hypothetical protein [Acidobacteriota bacterium]
MKRLILTILIVGVVVFISGMLTSHVKAQGPRIQIALVEFTQKVKLLDVLLKGRYLIVHDEVKMARGKPCTYVYRFRKDRSAELIVSFHCQPVNREKAKQFTTVVSRISLTSDVLELREYQFADSTEGHGVP